jgi:hypothetical protein
MNSLLLRLNGKILVINVHNKLPKVITNEAKLEYV